MLQLLESLVYKSKGFDLNLSGIHNKEPSFRISISKARADLLCDKPGERRHRDSHRHSTVCVAPWICQDSQVGLENDLNNI